MLRKGEVKKKVKEYAKFDEIEISLELGNVHWNGCYGKFFRLRPDKGDRMGSYLESHIEGGKWRDKDWEKLCVDLGNDSISGIACWDKQPDEHLSRYSKLEILADKAESVGDFEKADKILIRWLKSHYEDSN